MKMSTLIGRARRYAVNKGLRYMGTTRARAACWMAGYRAANGDHSRLIEAEAEIIALRAKIKALGELKYARPMDLHPHTGMCHVKGCVPVRLQSRDKGNPQ